MNTTSDRAPQIRLKLELAELRDLIQRAQCDLERLPLSLADDLLKLQKRIADLELEICRLESD